MACTGTCSGSFADVAASGMARLICAQPDEVAQHHVRMNGSACHLKGRNRCGSRGTTATMGGDNGRIEKSVPIAISRLGRELCDWLQTDAALLSERIMDPFRLGCCE